MTARTPTESGSAFFLILIGIFLFAGLSYAIMQSSRTSVATLTQEQARVAAQELMAYGEAIRKAVQTLRLRGCSDTQINFAPANYNAVNPLAPADKSCDVFDQAGGAVQFIKPTQWENELATYHDYWINGQSAVKDVGTSAPELILWTLNIKREICEQIRKLTNTEEFYETVGSHTEPFEGEYNLIPDGFGDDPGSPLAGKTEMCPNDNYVIVLIAR